MLAFETLKNQARAYGAAPPGASLHRSPQVLSGPGGAWQPALYVLGKKHVQAALVPLHGGKSIVLDVVWNNSETALRAAQKAAALASECVGTAFLPDF